MEPTIQITSWNGVLKAAGHSIPVLITLNCIPESQGRRTFAYFVAVDGPQGAFRAISTQRLNHRIPIAEVGGHANIKKHMLKALRAFKTNVKRGVTRGHEFR
ncbi:MAG: hypothetical protein C5B49_01950 [Bdellovibrio sp.]|nr:MAG: hypothetical protein C5B49_01950 [Bdellovibrio sp.]